jgi:hypothetical protein
MKDSCSAETIGYRLEGQESDYTGAEGVSWLMYALVSLRCPTLSSSSPRMSRALIPSNQAKETLTDTCGQASTSTLSHLRRCVSNSWVLTATELLQFFSSPSSHVHSSASPDTSLSSHHLQTSSTCSYRKTFFHLDLVYLNLICLIA